MSSKNLIRAWKDPQYRQQLSAQEQADLAPNPAGVVDLTDVELASVFGGRQLAVAASPLACSDSTYPCCPSIAKSLSGAFKQLEVAQVNWFTKP